MTLFSFYYFKNRKHYTYACVDIAKKPVKELNMNLKLIVNKENFFLRIFKNYAAFINNLEVLGSIENLVNNKNFENLRWTTFAIILSYFKNTFIILCFILKKKLLR